MKALNGEPIYSAMLRKQVQNRENRLLIVLAELDIDNFTLDQYELCRRETFNVVPAKAVAKRELDLGVINGFLTVDEGIYREQRTAPDSLTNLKLPVKVGLQ